MEVRTWTKCLVGKSHSCDLWWRCRGSNFYPRIHRHHVQPKIVKSMNVMHERGLVLHSCRRKSIGNWRSTRFWNDVRICHLPLKTGSWGCFNLKQIKTVWFVINGMMNICIKSLIFMSHKNMNNFDNTWIYTMMTSSVLIRKKRLCNLFSCYVL